MLSRTADNLYWLSRYVERGEEGVDAAGGRYRAFPFVGGAAVGEGERGETLRRLEDAREIFGPFDIAGQPEQIISGTRQHGARS